MGAAAQGLLSGKVLRRRPRGGSSEPSVSVATAALGQVSGPPRPAPLGGRSSAKTDNTRSPTASCNLCTSIQSVRVAGRVSLPMGKFAVEWGGAGASSPAGSALRTGRGTGGRARPPAVGGRGGGRVLPSTGTRCGPGSRVRCRALERPLFARQGIGSACLGGGGRAAEPPTPRAR